MSYKYKIDTIFDERKIRHKIDIMYYVQKHWLVRREAGSEKATKENSV